jgi:hypothetical protein
MTEAHLISIPDFIATEPYGRTKVYELIEAGELETVRDGKRRYIVAASYRGYIERLRAESNGKRPSPNPAAASYVGPGGHPPPAKPPAKRGAKGKGRAAR